MSADRQLPEIVGVRTAGLSPEAAKALQGAKNRSEWIRQAIEAYAAAGEDAVSMELLSELQAIKILFIQLTKQKTLVSESSGQVARSAAADAAAGILAAFGGSNER